MTIANSILNKIFGLLLKAGAWPGMIIISFLVTILVLIIFKYTSNQKRLTKRKNKVLAHVLELLIFKDDFVLSMKALRDVFVFNMAYLGELLIPFAASLAPVILILIQLAPWYDAAPLSIDKSTTITAELSENHSVMEQNISINAPKDITIESKAVRIPSRNTISWKIRPITDDTAYISININDIGHTKSIASGPTFKKVSIIKVRQESWAQLLNPAESPLSKESPLISIKVNHPEPELKAFGLNIHWLVAFFVLSMIFGAILMKPLKVKI